LRGLLGALYAPQIIGIFTIGAQYAAGLPSGRELSDDGGDGRVFPCCGGRAGIQPEKIREIILLFPDNLKFLKGSEEILYIPEIISH